MKSNKKTFIVAGIIILLLIGLIILFSMLLKDKTPVTEPTPTSTPSTSPSGSPATSTPTQAPTETPAMSPTATPTEAPTPTPTKIPSGKLELDRSIVDEWNALPEDGVKLVGQHDNSWYDDDYTYRIFTGLDLAVLLKERLCFGTKYALFITCPRICDGSVAIQTDRSYLSEYDTVYGFKGLQMYGSDGAWHKMYAINYGWLLDRADVIWTGYTSEEELYSEGFQMDPEHREQSINPTRYVFNAYDEQNSFTAFGDPMIPQKDAENPYTIILPGTLRHGFSENRLLWAFRPTDEFIADPIYNYYGELVGYLFRPTDPTLYREVDEIENAQTNYRDLIKNSPYQKMVDEGYNE